MLGVAGMMENDSLLLSSHMTSTRLFYNTNMNLNDQVQDCFENPNITGTYTAKSVHYWLLSQN